ncbi:hypothetical protein BN1723_012880, partial [Verticillium longisporum]
MPPIKLSLNGQNLTIPAVPLTPSAFAPFGDVIQNPHPAVAPSPTLPPHLALRAVSANQGSAIKYQHPSTPANHYATAPSGTPAQPVLNLFVCAARPLDHPRPPAPPPISTLLPYTPVVHHGPGLFRVRILERHPFTTQTFAPLAGPDRSPAAGYLVIVAPSRAAGPADEGLPNPDPAAVAVAASASGTASGTSGYPGPTLPPHLALRAVSANQGSAIKYQHPSVPANHYATAPSGTPAQPVLNLFVCAARPLDHPHPPAPPPISTLLPYTPVVHQGPGLFRVRILERHPFTTQTFAPLAGPDRSPAAGYLVIVAPSKAAGPEDEGLPNPDPGTAASASGTSGYPGRGVPDLAGLRAFVATTGQAVTYGAGTWHAPMVALGPQGTSVEFVVTQFANGVADEDCQEVVFGAGEDGSVVVQVPERSGLGGLAKL